VTNPTHAALFPNSSGNIYPSPRARRYEDPERRYISAQPVIPLEVDGRSLMLTGCLDKAWADRDLDHGKIVVELAFG
jgi:hypothetical protein